MVIVHNFRIKPMGFIPFMCLLAKLVNQMDF